MNLGPRPSDPSQISFAKECFVEDGERVEFSVAQVAPLYPVRFEDRAKAEAFARKIGSDVTEKRTPIMRRVCWN